MENNYNDWCIKAEKLSEYYDEAIKDYRCCPIKYTWEKVAEDDFGNKIHSYVPFDTYRIPRNSVDSFIDEYCSELPKYGIYILYGKNEVYVGKATNNDRAHSHNVDPIKGNWYFQYLFVPNNDCIYTKTYWNNENFMTLLESLLIDKLYKKFGDYYKSEDNKFKNRVAGQDIVKSKLRLNNNEAQIKFADLVADWISYAYTDLSGDDSFVMTNELNKDWKEEIENGFSNSTISQNNKISKRNSEVILKRLQNEVDPSITELYWWGNTCTWKVDERLGKEFVGHTWGMPTPLPHFHFEWMKEENTYKFVVHLEKQKQLGDENYKLYKTIHNAITSQYKPQEITPITLDNAIAITKKYYYDIKDLVDKYLTDTIE